MSDLLSRLDGLRKWLLNERQAVSVMNDPLLVRQGRETIDGHLATVDDACEGIQVGREPWVLPTDITVDLAALKLSEPIHPSDYKAAQEEINSRMGLGDGVALSTLRALVHQISISEYRDKLGHPLKNNVAYRDAEALLALTTSTKSS